ncbi:hypothetical protein BE221DRAFT_82170 [Ostreococcus tauri]|uniref:Uncharacterized protein n=1 Tax=Ostreococcus tauri TaxID=70448 RepID=A0A1Y5IDF9_OSTTA|nr:hypothetical protein BE221DRAFT_82170 [Ostreococcus tauri]
MRTLNASSSSIIASALACASFLAASISFCLCRLICLSDGPMISIFFSSRSTFSSPPRLHSLRSRPQRARRSLNQTSRSLKTITECDRSMTTMKANVPLALRAARCSGVSSFLPIVRSVW